MYADSIRRLAPVHGHGIDEGAVTAAADGAEQLAQALQRKRGTVDHQFVLKQAMSDYQAALQKVSS